MQPGANTHRDLGAAHKRRGGLLKVPVPELCVVDGLFAELVVLRPEGDAGLHPVHVDAAGAAHPLVRERWCERLWWRRGLLDRRNVRPRVLGRQHLRADGHSTTNMRQQGPSKGA